MYQVYIVDDAVLTRKALVMTMPWDQWGCVVVGSADDGEKAFEDIREMEPDIVITDIRMVHVGGLELIGRCRAQGIRSQFIIISGYNEFEYAKAALRMEGLYLKTHRRRRAARCGGKGRTAHRRVQGYDGGPPGTGRGGQVPAAGI